MDDRQFKDAIFENLARVGKALGSPKRLELLDVLAQGPRTVEVLADQANMTVANASRHLRLLHAARLVDTEKHGLFVTYRLADEEVADYLRSLRTFAEHRLAEIERVAQEFLEARVGMEPVNRETLRRRVRQGKATVLDMRPPEEFAAGHIAGAISVPLAQLEQRLNELPRDRDIVAYCRGPYCVLSVHAVETLRRRGFRAVRLEDGVADWQAQGFPVAAGDGRR
ncbi:MAG: metalloregulator ArsR/SmtB family transcription factor [Kiritimatiellae bacterium]|nr:metalloregulator ArsR/SmtB family transcription factor [Kiritimatiellia bacterium]